MQPIDYQKIKEALMPVAAPSNALAQITTQAGMEVEEAKALIEAFMPLRIRLEDICADANLIDVKDEHDTEGMARAKEGAKKIGEVRKEVEANRVKFKDKALKYGQGIDKIGRWFKDQIEPAETRLKELAKFAERVEAEKKAKLAEDRAGKLRAVNCDPSIYPLGDMSEEAFENLLEGQTLAHNKRLADAAKVEADRIAADAERTAREASTRAENERLRVANQQAEADAAAARAATAKAIADARKKADDERAAALAELETANAGRLAALKKLDEEKAEKQRQADAAAEDARRAAAAPDKAKLLTMAKLIRAVPVPVVHSAEAAAITTKAREWIVKLAERIEQDANKL